MPAPILTDTAHGLATAVHGLSQAALGPGLAAQDAAGLASRPILDLSPAGYLVLIVAVGAACQWLAWRLRTPSILLLLLVGFGLGQLVTAEQVLGRDIMFDGVELAVGVILFEGSMSLRLRQAADLRRPIRRLCSVTVLVAWALITLATWLLGFDIRVALLVGAILVVTGPTVISPIVRALRPTRRVSSLLRWEGSVVDPIGAVLGVLVFQGAVSGEFGNPAPTVVLALGETLLVGVGLGLIAGALLELLTRRHAIPDFLHGVVYLSAAIAVLVAANAAQSQSGLVAVTVLGVYLGNRPNLHLEHVAEFTEHLQVLLVGALFLVLAGRVTPSSLVDVAPKAFILLAALVLVVRPVSVLTGLWGTGVTRAERTLLACMAPRGVVAAAITSVFALGFSNRADALVARADAATGEGTASLRAHANALSRLATQAQDMVPMVFIVIVCTVAIYSVAVRRIGERLSLASAAPQGVMFAGFGSWVVAAATLLQDMGVPTRVVARNNVDLRTARMAGLPTEAANILSEYAVKDMDLAGMGYFIACTPSDEVNATAAREFIRVFGRANVFQLHRAADTEGPADVRRNTAGHLTARFAFSPSLSRDDLEEKVRAGLQVRRTRLTSEFTLDDFRAHNGADAVILFYRQGGSTHVAHGEAKIPQSDVTLIALVPPAASTIGGGRKGG